MGYSISGKALKVLDDPVSQTISGKALKAIMAQWAIVPNGTVIHLNSSQLELGMFIPFTQIPEVIFSAFSHCTIL